LRLENGNLSDKLTSLDLDKEIDLLKEEKENLKHYIAEANESEAKKL